nr:CDP-diacylglycerol---glycerol-3-phosphate 3-phosphatidyltransferase [Candidatus Cloacimonadota bacterium]
MRKYIPNILTIVRFMIVPFFVYAMFIADRDYAAYYSLFFFVIASITDYIDGTLARKWDVVSDFGKIMDPLADKVIVLCALAGLVWMPPFQLSPAIFFIIFLREAGITFVREIYQNKGIVVAADKWGKLKTVMQMFGIIFALAAWAFLPEISSALITGVSIWFWLVVCITLLSGFNYIKALLPRRNNV